MITAELADGRTLEFPDDTDPSVIQSTVKKVLGVEDQQKPVVSEATPDKPSRIVPEIGKGLIRGASNVAEGMAGGASQILLGPVLGTFAKKGIEALGSPSRELVKAEPNTGTERFAGTAAELAGGGIAGGGAGTLRNAAVTGGAALGGATGEILGGDIGKFLGVISGVLGTSAAISVARKLGVASADIAATVGASVGNKGSIERLASKAVTAKAGEDASRIQTALKSPTEYVPGAKITAGEAITEAQMGKPEQFGGAVVRMQKDLYGAPGVENTLPTIAKQQASAIENHLAELAKKTGPMRERALDAANFGGGVKTAGIIGQINAIASEPGIGASKVVQKTLATVKEDIDKLTKDGVINAKDLYTVRKEIGNTIQTHAKETATWDKHLSSGLQRRVQVAMDDAIEAAGGTGWKQYLATESFGRQAVEKMQDRLKSMKLIQAQVKGQSPGALVAGEVLHPPTLLNRPMMVANYALKLVASDANSPVVKRVAEAMTNPQELSKLIKLPISHPDRIAMHFILNSLVASKIDEASKQVPAEQPNREQGRPVAGMSGIRG